LYYTTIVSRHEQFAPLARSVARGITRLQRDEVCCADLTLQQFDTLRVMQAGRGETVSAIAYHLGIDISTASRNVRVLERAGYVARHVGAYARDARIVALGLTSSGLACVSSLICDERMLFAGLLAKVPAAQRAAVVKALGVLDRAITEHEASPESTPEPCCPPASPPARRATERAKR